MKTSTQSKYPKKITFALLVWALLLATCASQNAVPASVLLPTPTVLSSFRALSVTATPSIDSRPLLPVVEIEAIQTAAGSPTTRLTKTNNVEPSALVRRASIPLFASSSDFPNNPESYLDLDTGATPLVPPLLNLPQAAFDLQLLMSATGESFLKPINGALARPMRKRIPGFNGCHQILISITAHHLTSISVGDYFCFVSNQGHLSQIKVEEVDHLGKGSARIAFLTWWPTVAPKRKATININPSPTATILEQITYSDGTVSGLLSLFAEPSIRFSDPFNVKESYLDLDQGATEDVTGGDLQYSIGGGSMRFDTLDPVNGARSRAMGQSEPGFEGCKSALDSFTEGSTPELDGTYFCVLTNEERLSQVRIEKSGHLGPNRILLSFITWQEIVAQATATPSASKLPRKLPTATLRLPLASDLDEGLAHFCPLPRLIESHLQHCQYACHKSRPRHTPL